MLEGRSVYRVLLEKPERKRPMGRPSCRWEDNKGGSSGSGMWGIELAQDRQVVGTCECGNEPWGSTKCGEFLDWLHTG
jgi:hypothetical protein